MKEKYDLSDFIFHAQQSLEFIQNGLTDKTY